MELKKIDIWQVKETPCFPASWKVYPARHYHENNDTSNYFRTRTEALAEATRRNDLEQTIQDVGCICGSPDLGFDCTCDWSRRYPGLNEYMCEFDGLYTASRPRCNKCELVERESKPQAG